LLSPIAWKTLQNSTILPSIVRLDPAYFFDLFCLVALRANVSKDNNLAAIPGRLPVKQ